MALLFAEQGYHVSLQDPTSEAMDSILESAKKDGLADRMKKYNDYASLCKSLDTPKLFVWSLPHGSVGDSVLDGLLPYLAKGDIIIDCGNEHWQNTERRQGKCVTKGIRYVGCGVSGGYQAAYVSLTQQSHESIANVVDRLYRRRGPSMCPGADDETLSLILPILRKVAAKATDGSPCVGAIGTGGAGHFCKMIHNGIEHGMMASISEAWGIMRSGLGMTEDEIGDELERWNGEGGLRNTFLIKIGVDICRKINKDTNERVLDTVEDKVVQDYTGEEGTGIWSNTEAVDEHVPAPTLSTAHFLRIASGDLHQRREIQRTFGTGYPPQKLSVSDRKPFVEELRLAVYTACLLAYAQGMNIIGNADKDHHFNTNYTELLQVWRAGCIIQADYINRDLLTPIYSSKPKESINPLYAPTVAAELKKGFPALRKVVVAATEGDHIIPSLSASLEYLKYQTSTDLPTSFYEAELDYFGKHMYDKKGDDPEGKPQTGKHHYEWKPA